MPDPGETAAERLSQLRRDKAARLAELMQRRPGQPRYRRTLRAYLEADDAVKRAIIERLGLSFRS